MSTRDGLTVFTHISVETVISTSVLKGIPTTLTLGRGILLHASVLCNLNSFRELVETVISFMKNYHYIDRDNRTMGPVPGENLNFYGVDGNTLVWCEGMAEWKRASEVPELATVIPPCTPSPKCRTATDSTSEIPILRTGT